MGFCFYSSPPGGWDRTGTSENLAASRQWPVIQRPFRDCSLCLWTDVAIVFKAIAAEGGSTGALTAVGPHHAQAKATAPGWLAPPAGRLHRRGRVTATSAYSVSLYRRGAGRRAPGRPLGVARWPRSLMRMTRREPSRRGCELDSGRATMAGRFGECLTPGESAALDPFTRDGREGGWRTVEDWAHMRVERTALCAHSHQWGLLLLSPDDGARKHGASAA